MIIIDRSRYECFRVSWTSMRLLSASYRTSGPLARRSINQFSEKRRVRILINCHWIARRRVALYRSCPEFQQRGHDARLHATAVFEPFAREVGVPFKALGSVEDYESLLRDPDINHPTRQLRVVVARGMDDFGHAAFQAFFFFPVTVDGRRVFDGGLRHNFPLTCFLSQEPRSNFIALYLGKPDNTNRRGLISPDLFNIVIEGEERKTVDARHDKVIVIDTSPVGTVDFNLTDLEKQFLLYVGKAAALEFLHARNLDDDPKRGRGRVSSQPG
jgi:hypothetical protein